MALYDLMIAAMSENELASQKRVIDALRARGAMSPATARSFDDFNVIVLIMLSGNKH